MLIALWIINGLLALAFIGAGLTKALRPKPALVATGMGWADDFADPTVKFIGITEVLGGIGLVLPLLLGIAPILAPIAATCLMIVMILGAAVHVRRHENPTPAVVLGVLSAASAVLGFLVVLG